MAGSHRLRVGIDFGTTYSGVAWTDTAKPDEVIIITEWPGGSRKSEKVPSEISYTSAGGLHRWGFEIKPGEDRLSWVKLLLQPPGYLTNRSATLARTKDLIPDSGRKKPVDVVADYLTCLRKHIVATIQRSYTIAFLKATPIDYVLTVPAIWTDNAKSLTLKAAEAAGLGSKSTLQLISEPDAAAAWTLLRDLKISTLRVRDAFVVVDCGGGTVDLISYEVMAVSPTLSVKECAPGTGGLCGSTFLNENFEALVRSRIGTRLDKMKTATRNRMMKAFDDDLKRSFSNSEDDDLFICPIGGLQDDPQAGIEDGGFVMDREDMKGIFNPVIDKIVPLVQEQISIVESQAKRGLRLSAILLVGGFGSSKYLLQRLETELKQAKRINQSPLEILQPDHAWSAIARGAALGIRISSRTARRHYGTDCVHNFIFGKDPLKNLYYSKVTGEALCSDCMKWYINKGGEVSEEKPIPIRFYFTVGIDHNMVFENILYQCDEEIAPEYFNQGGNPMKELCTLTSDLSMVPKSQFTKKTGPNSVPYYKIDVDLVMTVKSAMVIAFHLEFSGKKYESVTAKYREDFLP